MKRGTWGCLPDVRFSAWECEFGAHPEGRQRQGSSSQLSIQPIMGTSDPHSEMPPPTEAHVRCAENGCKVFMVTSWSHPNIHPWRNGYIDRGAFMRQTSALLTAMTLTPWGQKPGRAALWEKRAWRFLWPSCALVLTQVPLTLWICPHETPSSHAWMI